MIIPTQDLIAELTKLTNQHKSQAEILLQKNLEDLNDPKGRTLDKSTITSFIAQQKQLLDLLIEAEFVSLNKIKVSLSVAKWIKLKLGDALRVVIYHNKRHLIQAFEVLESKSTK